MRLFELASEASLSGRDARKREKAILELTRENATVTQVLGRLALRVQKPLDALDELGASRKEELEKLDVCLKRCLARHFTRLKIHAPET